MKGQSNVTYILVTKSHNCAVAM